MRLCTKNVFSPIFCARLLKSRWLMYSAAGGVQIKDIWYEGSKLCCLGYLALKS